MKVPREALDLPIPPLPSVPFILLKSGTSPGPVVTPKIVTSTEMALSPLPRGFLEGDSLVCTSKQPVFGCRVDETLP